MTESNPAEHTTGPPTDPISDVRPIALDGEIDAGMDLSGVVVVGDYLILGADEGHQLKILVRDQDRDAWRMHQQLALAKRDQEADIEAIACGDGHLYVVGSHSHRRKRMKPDLSVRRNLERLLQIDQDSSRNGLYRLPFDRETGAVGKAERIDLSKRLRKHPLLGKFFGIPGKENGIDIQGMSFCDDRLYLGLRGPVLSQNHVPVMVLEFDRPKHFKLKFVRLEGQGIRDMAALDEGFLVLSGPANDMPGAFCLWWWDGADQVPGKDRSIQSAIMLGAVSTPGGAKAEGLALLSQDGDELRAVVVYDTRTTAQVVSMRILLPGRGPVEQA